MQAELDWDPSTLSETQDDRQQTITLTVLDDRQLVESVHSIGQMPFTQFATLHSVSAAMLVVHSCLEQSTRIANCRGELLSCASIQPGLLCASCCGHNPLLLGHTMFQTSSPAQCENAHCWSCNSHDCLWMACLCRLCNTAHLSACAKGF